MTQFLLNDIAEIQEKEHQTIERKYEIHTFILSLKQQVRNTC